MLHSRRKVQNFVVPEQRHVPPKLKQMIVPTWLFASAVCKWSGVDAYGSKCFRLLIWK